MPLNVYRPIQQIIIAEVLIMQQFPCLCKLTKKNKSWNFNSLYIKIQCNFTLKNHHINCIFTPCVPFLKCIKPWVSNNFILYPIKQKTQQHFKFGWDNYLIGLSCKFSDIQFSEQSVGYIFSFLRKIQVCPGIGAT